MGDTKRKMICRRCGKEYEIDEIIDASDLYCLECRFSHPDLVRYLNEKYARL
jgi:late competence protein required for DNA uptake (superfamily II DNA/RNA helicase)